MNCLFCPPKVNDKFVGSGIIVPRAHSSAISTEVKALLNAKYNLQGYNFRRIMIGIKTFILVAFVSLFTACGATIPQESVDLSREVGVGLRKQHQAQIDLVNLHFSIRQKSLDEAMSRALDSYLKNLMPNDSIELSRDQLDDVAAAVMLLNEKHNIKKAELEEARMFLIKKLNENYLILNQANSSITGLLQSAVDVKEATSEAYKKLFEAIGGKINLYRVLSVLDDFVLKYDEKADKPIKLVEKLELIFKEKENKE